MRFPELVYIPRLHELGVSHVLKQVRFPESATIFPEFVDIPRVRIRLRLRYVRPADSPSSSRLLYCRFPSLCYAKGYTNSGIASFPSASATTHCAHIAPAALRISALLCSVHCRVALPCFDAASSKGSSSQWLCICLLASAQRALLQVA